MATVGWLSRSLADVPVGEAWLGAREREVVRALRVEKRRVEWLLGRWAAKCAVGAWSGAAPERIEILAAADGAPEPIVEGRRAPLALSLSHRHGRAIATVTEGGTAVGCDLELREPRSPAFVNQWLAESERELVSAAGAAGPELVANLVWSAKEAATKVRREGLRLPVRSATVRLDGLDVEGAGRWRRLRVDWGDEAPTTTGWWRAEPRWVVVIAAASPTSSPRRLEG